MGENMLQDPNWPYDHNRRRTQTKAQAGQAAPQTETAKQAEAEKPSEPVVINPPIKQETGQAEWENQINGLYDSAYKAQLAKLQGQYTQQKGDYVSQIGKADETYDPLRSEAYSQNAMAERSRKEAMANMGLSGAGGTSQTLQQRNTNAMLGTLSDIDRQKQDYTDNINLALGKLKTQFGADTGSAFYQAQSDRNNALLQQGNWEKQFDLSKSQITFDQAWALWKSKKINKETFESLTGMKL